MGTCKIAYRGRPSSPAASTRKAPRRQSRRPDPRRRFRLFFLPLQPHPGHFWLADPDRRSPDRCRCRDSTRRGEVRVGIDRREGDRQQRD